MEEMAVEVYIVFEEKITIRSIFLVVQVRFLALPMQVIDSSKKPGFLLLFTLCGVFQLT